MMKKLGALIGLCGSLLGCGDGASGSMTPDARGADASGPVADAMTDAAPDAPAERVLTLSLYRTFDLVDGDTENVTLVAVQDGDGAWKELEGDHGVYRTTLTAKHYGLAIGCATATQTSLVQLQRTESDSLAIKRRSCVSPTRKLDVTVAGIPADAHVLLRARGMGAVFNVNGKQTLGVDDAPGEIIATVFGSTDSRVRKVLRLPAPSATDTALAIDVGTQGIAPEEHAIDFDAVGENERTAVRTLLVRGGFSYALGVGSPIGTPTDARFQVMPPEQRKAGDAFDVELMATTPSSATTPLRSRSSIKRAAAPGDVHLDLLAAEGTPAPQWTTSEKPSLVFELAPKAGALPLASHSLVAFTLGASNAHQWQVVLSEAWRQAANAQRYALPDFSSLPHGASFALSPTIRTSWAETRIETTVSHGDDYASQSISASGTLEAKL